MQRKFKKTFDGVQRRMVVVCPIDMSNMTATKEKGRVFIGAEIPAELKASLDAAASHEECSFSHIVRKCLRAGVAHFEALASVPKVSIDCARGQKRSDGVARRSLSK